MLVKTLLVFCQLITAFIIVEANGKASYVALVPKTVRPGLPLTVTINVLKRKAARTRLIATLCDNSRNSVISSSIKMITPPGSKKLILSVPSTLQNGNYSVHVAARKGRSRRGRVMFRNTTTVSYDSKSTAPFIQTDKGIYKPGQTVRIRAFSIYPDLKPVCGKKDIIITDSKNNRIKQWLRETPRSCVFVGTLKLTEYTNLGEWTIEYREMGQVEKVTFTVEEYVLPKFEVKVTLPSYTVSFLNYFTGTVSATYTFGKPVKGQLVLRITTTARKEIEQRYSIDGEVSFRLLMTDVSSEWGGSVGVNATVIEDVNKENQRYDYQTVQVYRYREKLRFSDALPKVFKPRLTYTAILRITQQDDTPLENPDEKVKIAITYEVPLSKDTISDDTHNEETHNEEPVIELARPFPMPIPSTETKNLSSIEEAVPQNGISSFGFELPETAVSANIHAQYKSASTWLYLEKAKSPSNSYILLQLLSEKPKINCPGVYVPPAIRYRLSRANFISSLTGTIDPHKCFAVAHADKDIELTAGATYSSLAPDPISGSSEDCAGTFVKFRVTTMNNFRSMYYQVHSKGKILLQRRLSIPKRKWKKQVKGKNGWSDKVKETTFRIRLPVAGAPRAQVLVYFVTKRGEVVTDSVSFSLDGAFRNKVGIKFNKKTVSPGEKVALRLRAAPDSTVFTTAVDKSVLLLKSGNDVTQTDVIRALQEFEVNIFDPWRWWWWLPIPTNGIDAYSVFENAGLKVLTDAMVYKSPTPLISFPVFRANEALPGAKKEAAPSLATPSRVRKFFPETWLFDIRNTNKRGRAVIRGNAPDTITSWIASAFAVSPEAGLGVAPTNANLTTDFFLRLYMPLSAIRGEFFILQVDVFNYAGVDQNVEVTLEKGQFSYAYKDGKAFDPTEGGLGWKRFLSGRNCGSRIFPDDTFRSWDIKLNVDARSTTDADAVGRTLIVKAEGFPQGYSITTFIDLRNGGSFNDKVSITFPEDVVSDSAHMQITAIGDVMGPSVNGIEKLLQMSTGCGEQNLINFVPNVFVTQYLHATGRLTTALKNRAIEFLESGYQRQLQYKHDDGAYSAFGNRDKSGSTWLTAFVLKSFVQARDMIAIDPNVIDDAIKWLLKQQVKGEFKEPGIVIHKAMQGGSGASRVSLTAFTTIALLRAKSQGFASEETAETVDTAIENALDFITSGFPGPIENMYELAIVTYALHIAQHHLADDALIELEKLATEKDGVKFWTIPLDQLESTQPYKTWGPPKTNNRALDLEVTCYGLLTYAIKKDIANGIPVIKWISMQRNQFGGFISTQDTVLAIQALAEMAEFIYTDDFDILATVQGTGSGSNDYQRSFNINDQNSLVLQISEPPSSLREFEVSATGTGIALIETKVRFNTDRELTEPAFFLNHTISGIATDSFRLDVCFKWLRDGSCTMALLNIDIPTGMVAATSNVDTEKALHFKTAEIEFRTMSLYFDKVTKETSCVGIPIERVALIAKHKMAAIELTDYYEPSNKATLLFQPTLLPDPTIMVILDESAK